MGLMTRNPRPGSEDWWAVRDDRRRHDRLTDARKRLISGDFAPAGTERPTGLGYAGSDPATFGGGREAAYARMDAANRRDFPPRLTDADLLRPDEPAEAAAFDARRRAVAPGGAAAGGIERNVQGHRERVAALSRGYGGEPSTLPGAAALVGGGEFTVHPSEGDEARDARVRLLAGQRSAFLQGGTRGGQAYNAVLEAGGDEAAARDAVTAVQGQEMMEGPPLTSGDIGLEQAQTEAQTAMARAIAADPVAALERMSGQSPGQEAAALSEAAAMSEDPVTQQALQAAALLKLGLEPRWEELPEGTLEFLGRKWRSLFGDAPPPRRIAEWVPAGSAATPAAATPAATAPGPALPFKYP